MKENATVFQRRFSRCRNLLRFMAVRVLGSPERAEDAIENCWFTASSNPPRFEQEGAFRSWLLRVLIDAALEIRRNEKTLGPRTSTEGIPSKRFRGTAYVMRSGASASGK
jgi:DNA-directed RNA polymerase specialized sigma24 family protein